MHEHRAYKLTGPLSGVELLTVAQAMAVTGLGKTTIFELLKTNRLESVKILTARRITRRSVEQLIAAGLEG